MENIKRRMILSALEIRIFYRCAINSDGAVINLLSQNDSQVIQLFRKNQDHDHNEKKKIRGIDLKLKDKLWIFTFNSIKAKPIVCRINGTDSGYFLYSGDFYILSLRLKIETFYHCFTVF